VSDHGHHHDHLEGSVPVEGDWLELTTAGIDVGSATTQLSLAVVTARRLGWRYEIVKRDTIHTGRIVLTPYTSASSIDGERLTAYLRDEYSNAGLDPDDVESGVVILTGAALERHNSLAIARSVADVGGRFISVAAGDQLESTLAAHGSGAVRASISAGSVLNLDVGGATTKAAWCEAGSVVSVAAFDLGARVLAWGPMDRRIERIERAGRWWAERVAPDVEIDLGAQMPPDAEARVCRSMALGLASLIAGRWDEAMLGCARQVPVVDRRPPDLVIISGGFAEFYAGRESQDFGDLGGGLAARLREALEPLDVRLAVSLAGIQATVVGAGQYTVQVSGATVFRSPTFTIPAADISIVALPDDLLTEDQLGVEGVSRGVMSALSLYAAGLEPGQAIGVMVVWAGAATVDRLEAAAAGIVAGLAPHVAAARPVAVIADADIAGLLGSHLRAHLGDAYPLIVLDGVDLRPFDFIDIGDQLATTGAFPVTIKSLAFPPAAAKPPSNEGANANV